MIEELNANERLVALKIRDCLVRSHVGIERAVTSKNIVACMNRVAQNENIPIKMSDVIVRKMVKWLRVTNQAIGLCSTPTGGYYIAKNEQEFRSCCDSLRDRISSQLQTERALRHQLNAIINKDQLTINV